MEQEYVVKDLKELLDVIISRWWLIVLLCVICSVGGYIVTATLIKPIYESETSLFLGKEQGEIAGLDISLSQLQVYNQLIMDYRELSKTRMIIVQVINDLELNMDIKTFRKSLYIESIKDSRLFTVKFQHTNPQLATDIVNAVAGQLALKATEIVEVQNIRVIDKALVPEEPIKPNIILYTGVLGALGLMLAIFIILLIDFLDNTIKDENDVEKQLGLNVIGVIPLFKGEGR